MRSGTYWLPLPGPQTDALLTEADELYFGGAAGGGKTALLVGTALTKHHKSIIFRRQYADIKEIEDQVEEILGHSQGYNQNRKQWRLPGADRRSLEFGACAKPGSEKAFQGRAHDLKAFDELPQFTLQQYLFLTAWNRPSRPGQRCRIIAAGNPPTDPEGEWVIQRWGPWLDKDHPNPAKPGELRWFIRNEEDHDEEVDGPDPIQRGDKVFYPKSRTFIPANVRDNPYLGEDYMATLQALPEPLRTILLEGGFDADKEDDPWQVIPTAWVEAAMRRWQKTARPAVAMSALGVDVARGGKDHTVFTPRWGNWVGEQLDYPGKQTRNGPVVAAKCLEHVRDGAAINVDVLNVGGSVVDVLREQEELINPINALDSSGGSSATDRSGKLGFRNKRAEWWWRVREMLDPDLGDDICLPPSRKLKADLCAPKWKLSTGGIQIEPKEDLIKRLGRSTDYGDSCVYCLAEDSLTYILDDHFMVEGRLVGADLDIDDDLPSTASDIDWLD